MSRSNTLRQLSRPPPAPAPRCFRCWRSPFGGDRPPPMRRSLLCSAGRHARGGAGDRAAPQSRACGARARYRGRAGAGRIAGSLADPTLRITSDEIDRTSGPRQIRCSHGRAGIPAVGQAGSAARPGRRGSGANPGRCAHDRGRAHREGQGRLRPVLPGRPGDPHDPGSSPGGAYIARAAQDRYAQGRGSQQEVYKAEVENTRLATELVRLEAKRAGCRGASQRLAGPADRRAVSAAGEITSPAFRRGARAGRSDGARARRQSFSRRRRRADRRGGGRQAAGRQELVSGRDVKGRRDRPHRQRPERLYGGDRPARSVAMGPARGPAARSGGTSWRRAGAPASAGAADPSELG